MRSDFRDPAVDSDDWRQIGYHEAGHTVAAILIGRPVTIVSIRPGLSHSEITMMEPGPDFVFSLTDIDQGTGACRDQRVAKPRRQAGAYI